MRTNIMQMMTFLILACVACTLVYAEQGLAHGNQVHEQYHTKDKLFANRKQLVTELLDNRSITGDSLEIAKYRRVAKESEKALTGHKVFKRQVNPTEDGKPGFSTAPEESPKEASIPIAPDQPALPQETSPQGIPAGPLHIPDRPNLPGGQATPTGFPAGPLHIPDRPSLPGGLPAGPLNIPDRPSIPGGLATAPGVPAGPLYIPDRPSFPGGLTGPISPQARQPSFPEEQPSFPGGLARPISPQARPPSFPEEPQSFPGGLTRPIPPQVRPPSFPEQQPSFPGELTRQISPQTRPPSFGDGLEPIPPGGLGPAISGAFPGGLGQATSGAFPGGLGQATSGAFPGTTPEQFSTDAATKVVEFIGKIMTNFLGNWEKMLEEYRKHEAALEQAILRAISDASKSKVNVLNRLQAVLKMMSLGIETLEIRTKSVVLNIFNAGSAAHRARIEFLGRVKEFVRRNSERIASALQQIPTSNQRTWGDRI